MKQIITEVSGSIELHNQNAYDFFYNLSIPSGGDFLNLFDDAKSKAVLSNILNYHNKDYDEKINYAKDFSIFFGIVDKNADKILNKINSLNVQSIEYRTYISFIYSILENSNHNTERTYKKVKEISRQPIPEGSKLEHKVQKLLQNPWQRQLGNIGQTNPTMEEMPNKRFASVYASTYTPQQLTNIPHKLHYHVTIGEGENKKEITQIRFGTQAQVIDGEYGVAGAFKMRLAIQEKENKKHIYFNCLGIDGNDRQRRRESAMSEQLHNLEVKYNSAYVITLPSDEGLMDHHSFENTSEQDAKNKTSVINEFLAKMDTRLTFKSENSFDDIYWSKKVEDELFKSGENKEQKTKLFKDLIEKSIEHLGLKDKEKLTKAEQQAVYYHFIKFELTDILIKAIEPDSMNFSCKDAIDRGALASTYYNLVKSIESNKPLTYEEFEQGLQAPAAMVKGRGMNNHVDRIWNVIDMYVNTNYEKILSDENQKWLIEWRDMNCPSERAGQLLEIRISQAENLLKVQTDNTLLAEIINKLKDKEFVKKSGNKTCLNVIATCMALANSPDKNDEVVDRCVNAIRNLPETDDWMKWVKGKLYILAGRFISSTNLIKKGENILIGDVATELQHLITPFAN